MGMNRDEDSKARTCAPFHLAHNSILSVLCLAKFF